MTRSEIVGANIFRYRTSLGMSQSVFADMIGRSQTMVSMYEGGQRLPSTQIIAEIAKVLGVSFGDLYFSDEERSDREPFMDDPMPSDVLSKEERRLVAAYRGATNSAREIALETLENHPAETKERRA